MYILDVSYQSDNFGSDSVEADWTACKHRSPDEDAESMTVRVINAYLEKVAQRWRLLMPGLPIGITLYVLKRRHNQPLLHQLGHTAR